MNYESVDVKDVLKKYLQAELVKAGFTNVKVLRGDPQAPAEIPCIGINRVDDAETSQSLSDGHASVYDAATREYKDIYGTFFSEALELRIWHTNAEQRDRLYHAQKALLLAYKPQLSDMGLVNITLRGGRDEQDTTMTNAPMVLYWATITVSYLNPLHVELTTVVDTITAINEHQKQGGDL